MLRDALSTMAHDDKLLRERIAEVAHGAQLQLRIGMTMTAGEYVVARPLAHNLADYPSHGALGRHPAAANADERWRDRLRLRGRPL